MPLAHPDDFITDRPPVLKRWEVVENGHTRAVSKYMDTRIYGCVWKPAPERGPHWGCVVVQMIGTMTMDVPMMLFDDDVIEVSYYA